MDTKIENKKQVRKNGFTLIEILVVIGMIALLAAIVLIAINPARQFAQGRNTQRTSNVETILNAVGQRIADNKGILKGDGCGDADGAQATTTIDWTNGSEWGHLGCLVPTYMSDELKDPKGGDYKISKDANGRITVYAPDAELGAVIEITR